MKEHKDTPYIIIPFGNKPKNKWNMSPTEYESLPISNNQYKNYTQYCLYHENCINTCTHRCIMSAIGGFNKNAIIKLQNSIRNFDLHSLCRKWECSHDVGLGMYFYFTQLPSIPLVTDDAFYHLWHTKIFSEYGDVKYDNIMKYIWFKVLQRNHTFHYLEYIHEENEKGKHYAKDHEIYQMDGFHSTIFYQKYKNESITYHTHHYNSSACLNDTTLFSKWVTDTNTNTRKNYIKMCSDYKQYVVSNT